MTSQAQASTPLTGVRGLIFFAFPLHPANKPSRERAKHLAEVEIPMLFLQGTRDALAFLDELRPACDALGSRATLKLFENADHSFHVPARSGRTDAQLRAEMLDFARTEFPTATEDDLKASLDRSFADGIFSPDGIITEESWKTGETIVLEAGILKQHVAYGAVIDMRFVNDVLRELKPH